jgi:hypothetical protein
MLLLIKQLLKCSQSFLELVVSFFKEYVILFKGTYSVGDAYYFLELRLLFFFESLDFFFKLSYAFLCCSFQGL